MLNMSNWSTNVQGKSKVVSEVLLCQYRYLKDIMVNSKRYSADSIRFEFESSMPDSIRIRFERKQPIRRSLISFFH